MNTQELRKRTVKARLNRRKIDRMRWKFLRNKKDVIMNQVLVVFQEVPEFCRLLLLSVNDETLEKLKRFQDQYINTTDIDEELSDEMTEYFYPDKITGKFEPNNGNYELLGGSTIPDGNTPTNISVLDGKTTVIVCGFLL